MRTGNKLSSAFIVVSSILIISVAFSKSASGHNLYIRTYQSAVKVKVFFVDGTPGRNMKVTVKRSTKDSEKWELYSQGESDWEGKYYFSPDKPGKYRIEAVGKGGHGETKTIQVTEAGIKASSNQKGERKIPLPTRVFSGLGYIVGLGGLAFWYLNRRSKGSK